MLEAEKEIKKICDYLTRLDYAARTYHRVLVRVDKIYQKYLEKLEDLVCIQQKTFWQAYTANEKRIVENTVLLVNLLYQMNKVQLVLKTEEENALNTVNEEEIRNQKKMQSRFWSQMAGLLYKRRMVYYVFESMESE